MDIRATERLYDVRKAKSPWLGGSEGSGLLLAEVLETEPQLVVMPEEFGVFWDLCQKYLGHLQGSLPGERGS